VVTAVNAIGESAASSQASASLVQPNAPTGVTAIPTSSTSATITWNAVAGATSYNLYWSTTSGVTPANGTKIADVTSPYTQTGLTDGSTYYYVVTAVNAIGESAASSQASVSLMPPSSPTGVNTTPGNGQVQISWTAVSGAASYNIYYSITSGAGIGGNKITGANNPYTLTGLTNGTTYYFVVTAVNVYGESAASSQVSATPVLSAPTGVQATPGNGQVQISWTTESGAASYNIYYSKTSGAGTGGTKITGATSPYTVQPLSNGTTYYFVVTAVGSGGESVPSSQASAVPQASSALNVTGIWSGTYKSAVHGSGPGAINITQTGTSISGKVSATFDDPTYGNIPITGTNLAGTLNGTTVNVTQLTLTASVTVGGKLYICTGTFNSGTATINTQASPMTGAFDLTGSWSGPSQCGTSDTITGTGTLQ
jgi:fibronectin type 3 domain-containing protein